MQNLPNKILGNPTVQEVRIVDGKEVKVMQWPVAENPDKSWGARGFEREDR